MQKVLGKINNWWLGLWTIDLRSLALWRMGLGIIVLVDVSDRLRDAMTFYSESGAVPSVLVSPQWWHLWSWGVSPVWMYGCFGLLVLSALALTVGYKTRVATIVTWLLLLTLHHRNPMLLSGADQVLRLGLWFGFFLPLGSRWSLDARGHDERRPAKGTVTSVATAAVMIQVICMYAFNAWFKSYPAWVGQARAVDLALQIDGFATPLGVWLRQWGALLPWLSRGTYWWEAMAWVGLLAPAKARPWRVVFVVGFMLLHAGFGVSMILGIFPAVNIVMLLLFMPTWLLDWLETWFTQYHQRGRWQWHQWWVRLVDRLHLRRQPQNQPRLLREIIFIVAQSVVGISLVVIVWQNMAQAWDGWLPLPPEINRVVYQLGLDQYWHQFAPYPFRDDGWLVVEGRLADGQVWDIRRNTPVTWDKPALVSADFGNARWYKYVRNVYESDGVDARQAYGLWLCRVWNARATPERHAVSTTIYYAKENTLLPGEQLPVREQVLLWSGECPSSY